MDLYLKWRTATLQSVLTLEKLDLKCFDLCWDKEFWKEHLPNMQVRIASEGNKDVAFWCGVIHDPEVQDDEPKLEILKIGVHPAYRKEGASRDLLRDVWQFAGTYGINTPVVTSVCESLLDPAWPDCFIGGWLNKVGFRIMESPLVPAPHSLYGKNFAHAVRFQLIKVPAFPTLVY